jgi:hypothetical protein
MTSKEYLQKLLADQNLDLQEIKALESHREEVETYLRKRYGSGPVIRYAGSRSKSTMIKESYDLDIICYFPDTNQSSLVDIHKDMADYLEKEYTLDKSKATAIRIIDLKHPVSPTKYHIDVVPGRFIDGNSGDANLPLVKGPKNQVKTNIDTHIKAVSESGCREIIKLAKLWATRYELNFKTFVMETYIIDKLSSFREKDQLDKAFIYLLELLSNNFVNAKIIDPANPTGNIISDSLDYSIKNNIATAARSALFILRNGNTPDTWNAIFTGKNATIQSILSGNSAAPRTGNITPRTQWADDK